MPVSDPIADMLTRIRNAYLVQKDEVRMPHSRLKHSLADVLVKSGFLASAALTEPKEGNVTQKELVLVLKYGDTHKKMPAVRGVKRISKPGQRMYVTKRQIPRVNQGLGVAILSTPLGLLTDRQARRRGTGGELICTLW